MKPSAFVWICAVVLAMGCTTELGAELDPGQDPSDPDGGGGSGGGGTAQSCGPGSLTPGDYPVVISVGDQERVFDVHIPANYDPDQRTPVVFYFHPLLTDRSYFKLVGTDEMADQMAYISVYADGVGNSWNGGACCGPANGAGGDDPIDDIAFVREMAQWVSDRACVDDTRVYASGFSNGGFLSHRLACEASDLFAAIAPVSAVNGVDPAECNPGRAVPVLQINGTNDELVPYEGGFSYNDITNGEFVSARASVDGWIDRNGCDPTPTETTTEGVATCEWYRNCDAGSQVGFCTVDGGGHCWYGEPLCALGTNTGDIVATTATWQFLSQFSK